MRKHLLLFALLMPFAALSQPASSPTPPATETPTPAGLAPPTGTPPAPSEPPTPPPPSAGPSCTYELLDGRVVQGRLVGQDGQLLTVEPPGGQQRVLRREDIRRADIAACVPGTKVQAPPSTLDFVPRMVLVTLGAAAGEAVGFLAGYRVAAAFGPSPGLGGASLAVAIGEAVGAAAGTMLVSGLNLGAGIGACLGAVAGTFSGVFFLDAGIPWLAVILPAIGAALGYGIGYTLSAAVPPPARVSIAGVQVSPVLAFAPGGGHVGVVASF